MSADWLVGYIRKAAEQQEQTIKDKGIGRRPPVAPSEQVARFLAGGERWRVEQGLVTPAQFGAYELEMLKKIGATGGNDGTGI